MCFCVLILWRVSMVCLTTSVAKRTDPQRKGDHLLVSHDLNNWNKSPEAKKNEVSCSRFALIVRGNP